MSDNKETLDELIRKVEWDREQRERIHRGVTRANKRAEDAHKRLDEHDRSLEIQGAALGGVVDELISRRETTATSTAKVPTFVWVLSIVAGIIAGWFWAKATFTQTLASGEDVVPLAESWWMAWLFGAAVATLVFWLVSSIAAARSKKEETTVTTSTTTSRQSAARTDRDDLETQAIPIVSEGRHS